MPTTNVLTLPPETNKGNHPVVALQPSSPSTPPAYPHVLILSAVQQQGWALAEVARAVAAAGEPDRAEQMVRSIAELPQQARALTKLARAVVVLGEPNRARRLATDAEQLVRDIADPILQAKAMTAVAQAMAATGEPNRAEQLAHGITDPTAQAEALTAVAEIVGLPQASRLLAEAFALGTWLEPLPVLAKLESKLVTRIVDEIVRTAFL